MLLSFISSRKNLRSSMLSVAILSFGFFLFLTSVFANAEESPHLIMALPEDQVVIHLNATESKSVAQDVLHANINITVEDKNATKVQNDINTKMSKALSTAKKYKSVKVSTGGYYVYERTLPRTKERVWRGQQTLSLKSGDSAKLLELVGKLQSDENASMSGLNYRLSPEKAAEVKDSLLEDALITLQTKAKRAGKALGKKNVSLREVNVNEQSRAASPMMMQARGMEMADSIAAPVAQEGETTISLTVSATALLKP